MTRRSTTSGWFIASVQAIDPPPVVTDDGRGLAAQDADELLDVNSRLVGRIGREVRRPRGEVVAAQIGRDDPLAGLHQRCDLLAPTELELREAEQQNGSSTTSGPLPAAT
jgi:hypothetical protein